MKDWLTVIAGGLAVLLVAALIFGSIWLRFFAPCDVAGSILPVKEMPGRCLYQAPPTYSDPLDH